MITDLAPFIDLGWYTVPLSGELRRLETGKKTLPLFPEEWNTRYLNVRNTKATALGGVLTGEQSNIIAIDCDDTVTYNIIKSMDPGYKFHFVSKGKKDLLGKSVKAGVIIYRYTEELPDSFRLQNESFSLDFYSTNGFVYLPTEANKTKEPFELTAVKHMPTELVTLLKLLYATKTSAPASTAQHKQYINHLAPQIEKFVKDKQLSPNVFKVLTPGDFRQTEAYISQGYLYPDQVPEGRGSEYLSKVSAILGADNSISPDLYVDAMELINGFFSEPMQRARLSATIIEPMVEEKAKINNVPIWKYDEDWQEGKLQIITKRNEILDCFYDPNRQEYYLINGSKEKVSRWDKVDAFANHIETVGVEPPSKKIIKSQVPLVNVISTPSKDFGFYAEKEEDSFNVFKPTIPLAIFKNPDSYKAKYTRPTTIIQFLESLVPNNYMRNYLLRFLRRKFDKFEYSPVYLYFLGVPGAGKDTLVSIIESIIGGDSLSRPSVKQFLELYNTWILDKYFVQLDEYGNQLVKYDDKELAVGHIKAYTGKSRVRIRQMRTDGYDYDHSMTFIMTANKNPLFIEGDDRRMALFDCPNKLANEMWVQAHGGVTAVHSSIEKELNDFAYYLAVEVDNLTRDEYMEPPNTKEKKRLIAAKFGAAQRIAFFLQHKMFSDLEELAREYTSMGVLSHASEGRIYEDDLFDLYYEMTDGNGTKRGLNVNMKEFPKIPTTQGGKKAYYYDIVGLSSHFIKPSPIQEED
ncbi:hypothetical protein CL634_02105 [bacterium]|nr:hypothetical protein [bacterium]